MKISKSSHERNKEEKFSRNCFENGQIFESNKTKVSVRQNEKYFCLIWFDNVRSNQNNSLCVNAPSLHYFSFFFCFYQNLCVAAACSKRELYKWVFLIQSVNNNNIKIRVNCIRQRNKRTTETDERKKEKRQRKISNKINKTIAMNKLLMFELFRPVWL